MKISWLGQAGFRLVTDNGTVIMIDPYLSDTLRYKKGESYRREVPVKDELLGSHVDVVILTHIHDDHTDFGTLDRLLAANGPVAVLAPVNVLAALRARYARAENYMLFDPGIEITLNGIRFSSTYAAHSDEHPIGVVIEGDGKVVCHTGDTMFHSVCRRNTRGRGSADAPDKRQRLQHERRRRCAPYSDPRTEGRAPDALGYVQGLWLRRE